MCFTNTEQQKCTVLTIEFSKTLSSESLQRAAFNKLTADRLRETMIDYQSRPHTGGFSHLRLVVFPLFSSQKKAALEDTPDTS